jgi:acetyl esterase/lipase
MAQSQPLGPVSRRTALTGFGAGVLGVALATTPRHIAAQEATPGDVEVASNVVYGENDGQQLLLDVALPPNDAAERPAVVLIHGGAFMFGDREGWSSTAIELARAGYVAFNINYRLFSDTDGSNAWPAQLDDAQRAVRWVRANAATYGVDPERIAALGHSSGGQLAAFLGTRETRDNADPALAEFSSRVTCVVEIAGGMDMTSPLPSAEENAINIAVLGGTEDAPPDAAAYRDFSPITFVDKEIVPFLIMHGLFDADSPLEQSRLMTEAIHAVDREVFSLEFAGLTHRTIADWAVIGPVTLAFLGRNLRPDA